MSVAYNAAAIRILTPPEISERFTWAKVASLAEQYRKPAAWIERGLEACRRAGIDGDYFEQRYLQRLDVPRHDGADDAMREMLTERSQRPAVGCTHSRR